MLVTVIIDTLLLPISAPASLAAFFNLLRGEIINMCPFLQLILSLHRSVPCCLWPRYLF